MPFLQNNPLAHLLSGVTQFDYPVHSRIHPLKSFGNAYVKREDELGFGISGSKIRKYRSLIPYFVENKFSEVIVIGGANSNHVLGITQLLIENGIKPLLFLRGDKDELFSKEKNGLGNLFFLQLFVTRDSVHWVSRKDWPNVEDIALEMYPGVFILEEGGMAKEAMGGALTLCLDIIKNEETENKGFKHIFIDAGTGFTAILLLLGFAFLKKETNIHVLLLADKPEIFLNKLGCCRLDFEKLFKVTCPIPSRFYLHEPTQAKSFGSTNRKIFEEISRLAKLEGFLTDPVYSGKLFLETEKIMKEQLITEKTLIIHSGGALSLSGFQKNFT